MRTDVLNEYIFTKLVDDFAQRARIHRVEAELKQLEGQGITDDTLCDSPLTDDDLRRGLEALEQRRHAVSALLKELWPDLSA